MNNAPNVSPARNATAAAKPNTVYKREKEIIGCDCCVHTSNYYNDNPYEPSSPGPNRRKLYIKQIVLAVTA